MRETFVLDCSVAAKWVLPEPDRGPALRRDQLSAQQAREAFQLMMKGAPTLFDMRPRMSLASDLALRHRMSLWDCVYIALAVERDCPFLTADRRQFRARSGRYPSIRLLQ
jgi:predicted nucleic acid-binding protein